jgi:hypothetical protein
VNQPIVASVMQGVEISGWSTIKMRRAFASGDDQLIGSALRRFCRYLQPKDPSTA